MTEKSRKVFHLLHTLSPGGCEYMLLLLLPELKARGWEASVITLGAGGPLKNAFEEKGVPVRTSVFRSRWDLLGFFRLRALIRQERPGLVVGHLFYADLLIRIVPQSFLGTRTVSLIHSTYRAKQLWKLRLFERLSAWALRHTLVVSPAVGETALRYGLRKTALHIVPNPVDTTLFSPIALEEKLLLRKKFQYSTEAKIIISVANFIDYKRHIDLLEAFSQLVQEFPKLELILIGNGPEEAKLRTFVQKRDLKSKVRFVGNYLGNRAAVAETLRLSDLFVLPSLFEGMCTAIMEAMAAGLPVVASDIPENRVLIPDVSVGHLVPVRSPKKLAGSIASLLQNPEIRKRIGKKSRTVMLEQYQPSVIAETWERLYDLLTGKKKYE